MTLIKICGLTRMEDALLANELGADFVGFVFVPESPRSVTAEIARECKEAIHRATPAGRAPARA